MADDMDTDSLPYDEWIEESLRSVIKRAILHVIEHGLPAEHHFYITFRTADADVSIPNYLKAQHDDEMTIVLQYQYEELTVAETYFSVILRFNGKPETLIIPFCAITSFADPSVDFGLQLKMPSLEDLDDDLDDASDMEETFYDKEGNIPNLINDSAPARKETKEDGKPKKSGEVVTLDAFRKK